MKQSKRYKVIKEILGGVTHDVVYKVGDTVNENIFNGMLTGFLIANGFLEPIPETPQIEIVEGVLSQINSVDYTFHKSINKNSIVIANPPPEMKQIIEAVKNKKVYERYITGREIKLLAEEDGQNTHFYLNVTDSSVDLHKILIIPIEESEVRE